MEALIAHNTIEITGELFGEAVKEPLRVKYRAVTARLIVILGILLIVLCVVTWIMGGSPLTLIGEAVLMIAVMVWLRVSLPRTERRQIWRSMSQDGPPFREIKVHEDRFTVRGNAGIEEVFTWNEVTSSRITAHPLILKLETGQKVMMSREGFSTGSEADVLQWVPQPACLIVHLTEPSSASDVPSSYSLSESPVPPCLACARAG